jgi:hypothetical protein
MAGDSFMADSVQLWIKNGNERAMKLIRSWEESEFQSTLAAQHSKDYVMEVEQYAAALGTRGDYFMLKVPVSNNVLGGATAKAVNGNLYIDFMDIMGVAADVQLGKVHGYGKYSPFDSADLKVTDEMKVGIESEHLALVLNATVTGTTYVSQKIHGDDDDRLQGRWETTPAADTANEFWLRLKPTASNVFLIRYDSKIWVLPADTTTQKGFYEIADA